MALLSSLWYALLGSIFILGAAAQDYAITDYTVTGTGCVPGTVTAEVAGDSKNIAVKYNKFVANAGPNFGYDDGRKNCQLTLAVKAPSGYRFGFDKFSYTGSYSVGQGVTATYSTSYYFQATLDQAQGGKAFVGPARGDAVLSDSYDQIVWSACGASAVVGINTVIRVDNSANPAATGALTVRNNPSTSFVWQKC
ncbi:unnamed protein product [Cyclocybe aegerita]|uniref:Secreted protein n=1 Tax=Cyclocybe aegerita TaxID=1973307 RepID=A0A8S0VYI5_CYCAE|nr:unnamed protein product [Cyclocybe aegerita]